MAVHSIFIDVEPYVKNIDNHLEALNCYSKALQKHNI